MVLSDLRHPRDPLPDGVEFVAGDIRSQTDVSIALRGADAVIHLASYGEWSFPWAGAARVMSCCVRCTTVAPLSLARSAGMSDVEGLHTDLVEEVNVGGTQVRARWWAAKRQTLVPRALLRTLNACRLNAAQCHPNAAEHH